MNWPEKFLRRGKVEQNPGNRPRRFFKLAFIALLLGVLSGCGEEEIRSTPAPFVPPTARPTPASYDNVPNAATAGAVTRGVVTFQPASGPAGGSVPGNGSTGNRDNKTSPVSTAGSQGSPLPASPNPTLSEGVESRIVESAPDKTDPTMLARLFGSPGPGSLPGGPLILPTPVTTKSGGGGKPSSALPTPTLNTGPSQSRIDSLRSSRVSFLTAYRQALAKVQQTQAGAKLAFASANNLKPERTTWSFLFLSPDGNKMWKVIFDSDGPRVDLSEQAPSMQADANRIDMAKVLDTDELLKRAESAGLRLSWPVDIVNFQVEGSIRQPCFVMTNVIQGKQAVINAYTGTVVRDDFAK